MGSKPTNYFVILSSLNRFSRGPKFPRVSPTENQISCICFFRLFNSLIYFFSEHQGETCQRETVKETSTLIAITAIRPTQIWTPAICRWAMCTRVSPEHRPWPPSMCNSMSELKTASCTWNVFFLLFSTLSFCWISTTHSCQSHLKQQKRSRKPLCLTMHGTLWTVLAKAYDGDVVDHLRLRAWHEKNKTNIIFVFYDFIQQWGLCMF